MSDEQIKTTQPIQMPEPEPKTPREMLIRRLSQTLEGIKQMMAKMDKDEQTLDQQYAMQKSQAAKVKTQGILELEKMQQMIDYVKGKRNK